MDLHIVGVSLRQHDSVLIVQMFTHKVAQASYECLDVTIVVAIAPRVIGRRSEVQHVQLKRQVFK